jgi:hypothetical protein
MDTVLIIPKSVNWKISKYETIYVQLKQNTSHVRVFPVDRLGFAVMRFHRDSSSHGVTIGAVL